MADLEINITDKVVISEQDWITALSIAIANILEATLGNDPKHHDLIKAIGVLEEAKHELYRRKIGPLNSQMLFDRSMKVGSNL
jgi:hypothetical protein